MYIFIKLIQSCGAVPSAQSKTRSRGFCEDPKPRLCNFSSWPSTYWKPTRSVRCIPCKKQISGLRALEGNCRRLQSGDSLGPGLDWPNLQLLTAQPRSVINAQQLPKPGRVVIHALGSLCLFIISRVLQHSALGLDWWASVRAPDISKHSS